MRELGPRQASCVCSTTSERGVHSATRMPDFSPALRSIPEKGLVLALIRRPVQHPGARVPSKDRVVVSSRANPLRFFERCHRPLNPVVHRVSRKPFAPLRPSPSLQGYAPVVGSLISVFERAKKFLRLMKRVPMMSRELVR